MNLNRQNEFFNTENLVGRTSALIEEVYSFYFGVNESYRKLLRDLVQNQTGDLNSSLREFQKRLFDPKQIAMLAQGKEAFLEIKFKLKSRFNEGNEDYFYADELYGIVGEIAEQIQLHLEFDKYRDTALNNRAFVDFIHRIQEVRKQWGDFESKYRFASEIYRPARKNDLMKDFFIVCLTFGPASLRMLEMEQLQAVLSLVEELSDFYGKILSPEGPAEERYRPIEISLVENLFMNLGVAKPICPSFSAFFEKMGGEDFSESKVKQVLATSLLQVTAPAGKETNAALNAAAKKICKHAKRLGEKPAIGCKTVSKPVAETKEDAKPTAPFPKKSDDSRPANDPEAVPFASSDTVPHRCEPSVAPFRNKEREAPSENNDAERKPVSKNELDAIIKKKGHLSFLTN